MRDVQLEIPAAVREFLRQAVGDAGGNEVFFLGRVAWSGEPPRPVATLTDVEVFARGNATSVLALTESATGWDIAVHNHPSGRLEPSEPDNAVAFLLSKRRVGFAIVSNDAGSHYLVVPPFAPGAPTPAASGDDSPAPVAIDPDEVRSIFAGGGPLARTLGDGYEARQGQIDMALEVTRALNEDGIAALEAGTGVGKSFAYLVPAILWAVRNREKVVVSTGTINLQEQITFKDLPLLERALPVRFQFALVKGRNNFACRRKLEELEQDLKAGSLVIDDDSRQLQDLVEWAKASRQGSRSELGWMPPFAIWEQAMSESDKSLKTQCRHYSECFYYSSKRSADRADIVVVNHHLLFSDLRVRQETGNFDDNLVIPAYRRVVFDEAHHLEDIASEYFGIRFSSVGVRQRLSRLIWQRDSTRGVIPALAKRVKMHNDPAASARLLEVYQTGLGAARMRIDGSFDELEELVITDGCALADQGQRGRGSTLPIAAEADGRPAGEPEPSVTLRYKGLEAHQPFWDRVDHGLKAVGDELAQLLAVNDEALAIIERSRLTEEQRRSQSIELESFGSRLKAFVADLGRFREYDDESQVRWITLRPSSSRSQGHLALEFAAAPIRVAQALHDMVYARMHTVALTSATLSIRGTADFIADRLGLSRVAGGRYRFREHPSPFDYRRQAMTAVPSDFPLPDSPDYSRRVAEAVGDLLEASGGRAFVLFTSYSLLRRTFDAVAPRLRSLGLRPVAQGDAQRSEILDRFRAGAANVLFGTDSFWEGVDVKGRALECVIVTRLPFRVPTEPLQEARVEEIEARGESSFSALTVPQAVLKLKQGFGRLIRSQTDRGVVVVLDRRIVTKPYGRAFLDSLPETELVKAPLSTVVEKVRQLIGESSAQPGSRAP